MRIDIKNIINHFLGYIELFSLIYFINAKFHLDLIKEIGFKSFKKD
jgi:hypothetical protein